MSPTAAQLGLASCHTCDLVSRVDPLHGGHCPRCGSVVHLRKPSSLSRTWAFLLAACILYLPANMLPVMITTSLGTTEEDTIMSGIIYLWTSGSWELAVLIFIASFMVPLSKLISLALLSISVQTRSTWRPMQRIRLYRLVEVIGKWSMLDVYVASLMTALVTFGPLANIRIGIGAIAFGAVVVLTMLAAHAFDPRLIWDPIDHTELPRHD